MYIESTQLEPQLEKDLVKPAPERQISPTESLDEAMALEQHRWNINLLGIIDPAESVELDPRLATFKEDFDKDAAMQDRCSWEEIERRLLKDDGRYLDLAKDLEQGGELFGIDSDGNPLICDKGDKLIVEGKNYQRVRSQVFFKRKCTSDNSVELLLDENEKRVYTGYEMFPYSDPNDKSEEILLYEAHTGRPFVGQHSSSWLESGSRPFWAHYIIFDPREGIAVVREADPKSIVFHRGVRRLLRLT